MNQPTLPQEQLLPVRVALWTSLITIHTVFLAAVFAVVLATKISPSNLVVWLAFFALAGVTLPLLCIASTFAHLLDQATPLQSNSKFTLWWATGRPKLWVGAESASAVLLFACAALLFYAIFQAKG